MRLASLLSSTTVLLALGSGLSRAQDPIPLVPKGQYDSVKVTRLIPVTEDRIAFKAFPFTLEAPTNATRPSWTVPSGLVWSAKGRSLTVTAGPKGEVTVTAEWSVIDFAKQTITDQTGVLIFLIGGDSPLPPEPKPPEPKPPEPKPPTPVPVSSFRVIFVYESAKTLTSAQIAAMDSKAVRDYLAQNTTPEGGYVGYRKYDKDQDSSKDTPTINAMWQATKGKVTAVPCVAIEVNGAVDIVPLEPTAAAMVEVFKKYKSGQ